MLTLRIDKDTLDRILKAKGITARKLSQNLFITRNPTNGAISSWMEGGVVAPRWRQAIVDFFNVDPFDKQGCLRKSAFITHGINHGTLSKVFIRETITPMAISEWRGGGIDPDTLLALANYLQVSPATLLAIETINLLNTIMGIAP